MSRRCVQRAALSDGEENDMTSSNSNRSSSFYQFYAHRYENLWVLAADNYVMEARVLTLQAQICSRCTARVRYLSWLDRFIEGRQLPYPATTLTASSWRLAYRLFISGVITACSCFNTRSHMFVITTVLQDGKQADARVECERVLRSRKECEREYHSGSEDHQQRPQYQPANLIAE